MGYFLRVTTIASAIFCILCYPWRHLADYLYIIEITLRFLSIFHLNFTNFDKDITDLIIYSTVTYLLFTIGYRYEILINLIGGAWASFFGLHVAYARPFTVRDVFMYIILCACNIVFSTIMNLVFLYFGELNNKLRSANLSHVNLLNGMHEGLLILS